MPNYVGNFYLVYWFAHIWMYSYKHAFGHVVLLYTFVCVYMCGADIVLTVLRKYDLVPMFRNVVLYLGQVQTHSKTVVEVHLIFVCLLNMAH